MNRPSTLRTGAETALLVLVSSAGAAGGSAADAAQLGDPERFVVTVQGSASSRATVQKTVGSSRWSPSGRSGAASRPCGSGRTTLHGRRRVSTRPR